MLLEGEGEGESERLTEGGLRFDGSSIPCRGSRPNSLQSEKKQRISFILADSMSFDPEKANKYSALRKKFLCGGAENFFGRAGNQQGNIPPEQGTRREARRGNLPLADFIDFRKSQGQHSENT